MKFVTVSALAATLAAGLAAAAFAQMGDPSTMKCAEFMGMDEEGMGQVSRAVMQATTGENEISVPMVRKLTTVCSANPGMTVMEASTQPG